MTNFEVTFESENNEFDLQLDDTKTTITQDHANMSHLDYETSGHTGFASKEDIPTKLSELEQDIDYAQKGEIPNVPVQSVNGKTGDVNITCESIGAELSGTAIKVGQTISEALLDHTSNHNNPHKLTLKQLNGVSKSEYNPVEKTDEMTFQVGVDKFGQLWTNPYVPREGGWHLISHLQGICSPAIEEWDCYADGISFDDINELSIIGVITGASGSYTEGKLEVCINGVPTPPVEYGVQKIGNTRVLFIYYAKVSEQDILGHSSVSQKQSISQSENMLYNLQMSAFRLDEPTIRTIGFRYPDKGAQGFGEGTDLYIYAK